jgi:hypothetical protein
VLHLKLWENLTFAQIAEALEISPHTAANRYRYALDKLRDVLRPVYAERLSTYAHARTNRTPTFPNALASHARALEARHSRKGPCRTGGEPTVLSQSHLPKLAGTRRRLDLDRATAMGRKPWERYSQGRLATRRPLRSKPERFPKPGSLFGRTSCRTAFTPARPKTKPLHHAKSRPHRLILWKPRTQTASHKPPPPHLHPANGCVGPHGSLYGARRPCF